MVFSQLVLTGAYDAKLTNHETTERDLKDCPICLVSLLLSSINKSVLLKEIFSLQYPSVESVKKRPTENDLSLYVEFDWEVPISLTFALFALSLRFYKVQLRLVCLGGIFIHKAKVRFLADSSLSVVLLDIFIFTIGQRNQVL